MTRLDYVECVRRESARFHDAVTDATLDLSVAACPGWSVRDLAEHLGQVQRWAAIAASIGARPDDAAIQAPPADADAAALNHWLAVGSQQLCDALTATPPDAPTWHPFTVPQVAAVWPRRQAHEVAIHRWDAQHASGAAEPVEPTFAADFIREYYEVVVPRVIDRDGRPAPAGRLLAQLTDTGTSLVVAATPTVVTLLPAGADVDASIAGSASDVLLALWQRESTGVTASGALAASWLQFGGN